MVSNDAPIVMAKACELFIIDLTFRAQFFCKNGKRKILSKADVGAAISNNEVIIHSF